MRRAILGVILLLIGVSSVQAETLAALRYRTARKLAQDTATASSKHWTHSEIDVYINDAIRYISHASLCHVKETTLVLTIDSTDYAMPHDYIRAAGVVVSGNPIGLKGTAAADLGKLPNNSKEPTQWEELGESVRKIRFSPKPQVASTVRVTYYAYSRQLSGDTVNCLLPLAFQYCVPSYAAAECWSSGPKYQQFWNEFVDRLSALVPTIQKGSDPEVPAATPGGTAP